MRKRCDPSGLNCQEGQYTGCCIICGNNVYMTKEEYLKKLEEATYAIDKIDKKIKKLEDQLFQKE
jgi:formate dehydrogenase assembly factor FdhD